MKISISPQSGYFDRYLDIYFKVEFDEVMTGELRVVNSNLESSNIEILGSNTSNIKNGSILVIDKSKTVDGYLNLIPDESTTIKLQQYNSVELLFLADLNGTSTSEKIFVFNESVSIDNNILPFDLSITKEIIDVNSDIPLTMSIVSQIPTKYELCIMSECKTQKYVFEAFCRKGTTIIEIPTTVLFEELKLDKFSNRFFFVYWSKQQGVDSRGFATYRHIVVPKSKLKFVNSPLLVLPSEFTDIFNEPFSDDFILSDRYLVPVHKEFSAFGKNKVFNPSQLYFMSLYYYENQDIRQEIQKIMVEDKNATKIFDTARILNTSNKEKVYYHVPDRSKLAMAQDFKHLYSVSGSNKVTNSPEMVKVSTAKQGCGCGRKKT